MSQESILTLNNSEHLIEILHLAIDDLIKLKTIDFSSQDSLQKFNFSNADDFEFTIKFINNLYKKYCLSEINETELVSHFLHLTKKQQAKILEVVDSRKIEIYEYLIKEMNIYEEAPLLESFDWNCKWVIGNSALSCQRMQLATIMMNCRDSHREVQLKHFELNKNKLDDLIGSLEDCNKKLNE